MDTTAKISLRIVGGTAWTALLRFPAAMTAATAATAIWLSGKGLGLDSWLLSCIDMFFWAVALRLILEAKTNLSVVTRSAAPWVAGLALIVPAWPTWLGGELSTVYLLPPVLAAAGALAVVAAPLSIATTDRSAATAAWARSLAWVVALAGAAMVALCAGLSTLILGIDALFDTRLAFSVVRRLWTIGLFLILPWCALGLLPSLKQDNGAFPFPRWLSILLDWLLAPLALAYGVLLNIYCVVILAQWTMPKGVIASMVIGFALVGSVVWAAAFAAGPESGKATHFLRRAFLPGLLAPTGALFIAAWTRIGQHGVTEERYLLVLAAVLIPGLGGMQIIRRSIPSPSLVALAAAGCLLAVSAGPWSATGVSVRSQFEHLRNTLERVGHLRAGVIDPAGPGMLGSDAAKISSIVLFLVERGEKADILAHFREPPGDMPPAAEERDDFRAQAKQIVEAMGVRYVPYYWGENQKGRDGDREDIRWTSSSRPLTVTGFDYVVSGHFNETNTVRTTLLGQSGAGDKAADDALTIAFEPAPGRVHVSFNGVPLATLDLGAALMGPLPAHDQPIVIDAVAADQTSLRFLLQDAHGTRSPTQGVHLAHVVFKLLVGRKSAEGTR